MSKPTPQDVQDIREAAQGFERSAFLFEGIEAQDIIKLCDEVDRLRAVAGTDVEALEALDDLVTEATSQPPVELAVVRKAAATIRAALTASAPRADTERLDWLEENLSYANLGAWYDVGRMTMQLLQQTEADSGKGWQNGALRRAIDAARAAPSGEAA